MKTKTNSITCTDATGRDILARLSGLNAWTVQPVLDGIDWSGHYPIVDACGRLTGDLYESGDDSDPCLICDVDEDGISACDHHDEGRCSDFAVRQADAPDETED